MHPQTLRMYEARGLIEPSARRRTPASTRSATSSGCATSAAHLHGLNLAGVEIVLDMEAEWRG